jgi:acetyl-CoA carboxylase, biotin carboxylase subunit
VFSKVLIANRGEIAIRIIRACKEMGIATVAIYSQEDASSLHTAFADEAVCVGGYQAADSYLNQRNIISAALVTGAEAIHPGYGFLSENPAFAALCKKYGIVFMGPEAEVISMLGDKDAARKLMAEAGVPTVPGSSLVASVEEARSEAMHIGFPLLIKARAGGGGKGIRLVTCPEELEQAYHMAKSEAAANFEDDGVYLEKYLTRVKHIEIQIMADEFGQVIALGERECSIQRNRQKILEETPSLSVDDDLRHAMSEAACQAARTAGYTGIGTVEFLVDGDGSFYFMEMNTRLQVEHPITEMITDIDVVKWQIRIAAGVPLALTQDDVVFSGHAIECRINAQAPGTISYLHVPGGHRVRFDTALYQGYRFPPYYDSLMGKLIVHAHTREEAVRKMKAALCELVIDVPNNIEEQIAILEDPLFLAGTYDTRFVDHLDEAMGSKEA